MTTLADFAKEKKNLVLPAFKKKSQNPKNLSVCRVLRLL